MPVEALQWRFLCVCVVGESEESVSVGRGKGADGEMMDDQAWS